MKNIKTLTSLAIASSLIVSSIGNVIACTALVVTDINGHAYHGRTLEFTGPIPGNLAYVPVGTKIESETPTKAQGLTFNTKYPIMGVTANIIASAKQPTLAEGINDQGLSFSANEFNGSTNPPIGNNAAKILSVNDLGTWILGNFKNLSEVKMAMTSGGAEFWLPSSPLFGNELTPLHYAVFDKKGNGLVIEFTNGKTNVYDNPVGVMTNAPEFPWHLTNLNNYTFTNVNKNTGQLGKQKLQTQDAGIALTALPSAETATGRFVKATFYANYVKKGSTPDEAINLLAHIMNNFDRPKNLTIDPPGGVGDGPRGGKISSEVTQWTTLSDLSRNLFYFRSIDAMNWTVIDMAKLKNVTKVKMVSINDVNQSGADALNLFYK
ncbi:linear amide C-N hydrolase [Polynucleobacter sp. CS-Odin-A6]|uniref:linear amide C-N hydrolase n=1 Tax=Polynucleobacter sp. CS-Odin-A6 TaxID=2689106 RepID=UPI001C20D318|nr:linear amide C-N hydrolase [Polynucleobacter sp. CS-Odin-A6]